VIESSLSKQIASTELIKSIKVSSEVGNDVIKGSMICIFVLNVIMSGILGKMVKWVNTLQIITMFSMLSVVIPGLAIMILKIVTDIAEFDVLNNDLF
jgi:hypothetical protein